MHRENPQVLIVDVQARLGGEPAGIDEHHHVTASEHCGAGEMGHPLEDGSELAGRHLATTELPGNGECGGAE